MSAPALKWYSTSEVEITAALSFTGITPGTPSAAQEIWLVNGIDGAGHETARNLRLYAYVRTPGETDYQADGREFVDKRYAEVRIKDGYNQTVQTAGYTKLGAGSYIDLPACANDEGVKLEFRVNSTLDATTAAVEVLFTVEGSEATALETGHTEAGPDGVLMGLGDGTRTYLLKSAGDVLENPGGADEFVQVPDVVGICAGEPKVTLEHLLEFTGTDGAAAALIAGESYYGLAYITSAGVVSVAKGTKVTDPLTEADKPATPAGGIPLAYVKRAFDGLINTADIENVWKEGAYSFRSTGLTGYVGPGRARVDNSITSHDYDQTVTLTDDATNHLWRQKDGSLAITTDGSRPTSQTRAMLLYVLTVATSAVTAVSDRRRYIGGSVIPLFFRFDTTLAPAQSQFAVLPCLQGARLRPYAGVYASLDDQGSGTASGSTIFDVSYCVEETGSPDFFTTIYTSQGTEDRRPTIAYDSTLLTDYDSQPEVVDFPGGIYRFRADVDAIPGSGTAPSGASLCLLFEER